MGIIPLLMQCALYFDVTFYVNGSKFYPLKLLKTIDNNYYVIAHYLKTELKYKLYVVKTMSSHGIHYKVLKECF